MDSEEYSSGVPGFDNQGSNEPAAPGTVGISLYKGPSTPLSGPHRLLPSLKGVENAKKRLRAFSIQKKTPISAVQLPKATVTGTTGATVLIGKLSSVKTTPKVEDDQKKQPRPPKPGSTKRNFQDSYTDLQKRTLAEIEDMKRKMELIDLGIPLGLICPSSSVNDKAMPTKAMPPIKSFLEPSKVDELIREAKKSRAEGKEFKFDYQKLLPGYDNPFQRKKDDPVAQEKEKEENTEKEEKYDRHYTPKSDKDRSMQRDKDKRKSDRYDGFRRHSDYRKESRDRYKERRNEKDRNRLKGGKKDRNQDKIADKLVDQESKETDVNLNDYLVCDSWSLDNDDKTSSPQVEDKTKATTPARKETESNEAENKDDLKKKDEKESTPKEDSPISITPKNIIPDKFIKIDKLKPVIDSFKFEIDPNDDDQDIFNENAMLEDYAQLKPKTNFDFNQDTSMSDSFADESFLESVINEIKQEDLDDDTNDDSQDKGLVEYDSPLTDYAKGQGTPELDDSIRFSASERSDFSESYRSTDSGCKSTESGYKSTESGYKSIESGFKSTEGGYKNTESGFKSTEGGYKEVHKEDSKKKEFCLSAEKELDTALEQNITKATGDSLDMWNFVLKICQPLLFRHDKSKCYRQTRTSPPIWWAERVATCGCVRGRSVVTGELAAQRMRLVDRVYGCDQLADAPAPAARGWYPAAARCLAAPAAPRARRDSRALDREYERFMEAVWGQTAEATSASNTPVRAAPEAEPEPAPAPALAPAPAPEPAERRRAKLSSEGWSQDSEADNEPVKRKKQKERKEKAKEKSRKRKISSSTLSTTTDEDVKRKRVKKKFQSNKKLKAKLARKKRNLKKLKEKHRKKKRLAKMEKISDDEEIEEPKKKPKVKKTKKKQVKTKKAQKKKKVRAKASSSSSSFSSSDSDDRKKKSKKKKKQRKEDAFDVNILNNIKTEKLTDDENEQMTDFSPRRHQTRRHDIINVKELQNDLVGVQIKQEVEERSEERSEEGSVEKSEEGSVEKSEEGSVEKSEEGSVDKSEERSLEKYEERGEENIEMRGEVMKEEISEQRSEEAVKMDDFELSNQDEYSGAQGEEGVVEKMEFKEPQDLNRLTLHRTDETNISQCSSQESLCSETDHTAASQPDQPYEKDESHLRPSSQNSNYSFNDVIASQNGHYGKGLEGGVECEKFDYEQENYEIYEQLAMAYQSDVASNQVRLPAAAGAQRIETVVLRGEIKCDWRAGDAPAGGAGGSAGLGGAGGAGGARASRWGLKPGEANIVLTGAGAEVRAPVYRIETLANRGDSSTGYDEAYMDTYGALDRLQYGDCFEPAPAPAAPPAAARRATLDARIHQALRHSVLGDIAMEPESQDGDDDKDKSDTGILITTQRRAPRGKRVSFADGYKPGQDSDTEEPPVKKRKKVRRLGCAWPCPATHPDHVPLWDALPPPPPPRGSPPPPARAAPPLHLLRAPPAPAHAHALQPAMKFDPNVSLTGFMPPEPPPGLIQFP